MSTSEECSETFGFKMHLFKKTWTPEVFLLFVNNISNSHSLSALVIDFQLPQEVFAFFSRTLIIHSRCLFSLQAVLTTLQNCPHQFRNCLCQQGPRLQQCSSLFLWRFWFTEVQKKQKFSPDFHERGLLVTMVSNKLLIMIASKKRKWGLCLDDHVSLHSLL